MDNTYIERDCTIELKGRKFTAGGALATDNYLVAYVGDNGMLCDWHGNKIGTYHIVSSRKAIFFGRQSWIGDRYYYMRGRLEDGRVYSLRGFGKGMIAQGKQCK